MTDEKFYDIDTGMMKFEIGVLDETIKFIDRYKVVIDNPAAIGDPYGMIEDVSCNNEDGYPESLIIAGIKFLAAIGRIQHIGDGVISNIELDYEETN